LGSAIHVISEEESLRAIEVARAECLRNRSLDEQAMRGNQDFCLAEFASAVCWPSTPGNHTVTMPCPHYVPGVRKHGQVSRRCFWSSSVDDATNGSVGHWRFSDVEFRDCLAVVESSSVYRGPAHRIVNVRKPNNGERNDGSAAWVAVVPSDDGLVILIGLAITRNSWENKSRQVHQAGHERA
ncbi:hypothetical protein T265_15635, partial [Opisthorchis viverrini]